MRPGIRLLVLASTAAAFWLGCNALLGIETAVHEPDGGSTSPPEDARSDGAVMDGQTLVDAGADGEVDAGPCVDTASNTKHCGSCNHDCLGGACVSGKCRPVVIANDVGGPFSIALDGTHVYWTNLNTGTIRRVPTNGGTPEVLFSTALGLGNGLALVTGEIYFARLGAGSGIFRCPVTGCGAGPTLVVAGNPVTFDIAAGGVLAFSDTPGQEVRRCTLPCATGAQLIATGEGSPASVAGAADRVYWGNLSPSALRFRVDGDIARTLVNGVLVGEIVVTNDTLVYAQYANGPMIAALDGGSRRALLASGAVNNDHLVLRDGHAFFNDYGGGFANGRIFDCPLSGCDDGGAVATGQETPRGVAVDDKGIYWANSGDDDAGAIMRLAR